MTTDPKREALAAEVRRLASAYAQRTAEFVLVMRLGGDQVSIGRICDEANDTLNAAIDSLAALQPPAEGAVGWLPISEAPKDRTEVLAWREDCGPFIASYTQASAFPLTQKEIDELDEEALFCDDWFTQWPDARRLEGSEVPTHFMPLPASPTPKDNRHE